MNHSIPSANIQSSSPSVSQPFYSTYPYSAECEWGAYSLLATAGWPILAPYLCRGTVVDPPYCAHAGQALAAPCWAGSWAWPGTTHSSPQTSGRRPAQRQRSRTGWASKISLLSINPYILSTIYYSQQHANSLSFSSVIGVIVLKRDRYKIVKIGKKEWSTVQHVFNAWSPVHRL